MTHPPQEILIKVMCSECGGSGNGTYFDQYAHMDLPTGEPCKFCTNGLVFSKEPATRVVLTVEEFENIKERHRKLGYLEAREDMDDERDADDLY